MTNRGRQDILIGEEDYVPPKRKLVHTKAEMGVAKQASVEHCLAANMPPGKTEDHESRTYNVHAPYAQYAGILACVNDGVSHPACPCPCGHEMRTKRSALLDSTEMQWRCFCYRYFNHLGIGDGELIEEATA